MERKKATDFDQRALDLYDGYPGNDDEGRTMQAKRNPDEMIEDFIAAAETLKSHSLSTHKVGAVGFCYGGGVVNQLAVRCRNRVGLTSSPRYKARNQ